MTKHRLSHCDSDNNKKRKRKNVFRFQLLKTKTILQSSRSVLAQSPLDLGAQDPKVSKGQSLDRKPL
jgi:hypothetical protein